MAKRVIEQLINAGVLPAKAADLAAIALGRYPNLQDWRRFFERLLVIVGVVAIAFSVIFFIAFNWLYFGKMGKFALVEGALITTLVSYFLLVFLKKSLLLQQLLLLAASLITGALLALVGQVYQTGADSWQLFAAWSALILPWVLISRFAPLWLLWLGLINLTAMLSADQAPGLSGMPLSPDFYTFAITILLLTLINGLAFLAWLKFAERLPLFSRKAHFQADPQNTRQDAPFIDQNANQNGHQNLNAKQKRPLAPTLQLHWSTYIVGLAATGFASFLMIIMRIDETATTLTWVSLIIWLLWLAMLWYQFYWRHLNLLMLTYFCVAIISVLMVWFSWLIDFDFDIDSMLLMATVLLIASTLFVSWLRRLSAAATLRERRP